MELNGTHSALSLEVDADELASVSITLFQRKMQKSTVVVTRRCICKLQGRMLCGVCVLRRRMDQGRIFPAINYADGLACLKAGAMYLKFDQAASWGTHAFRRGWATEALRAGGVTALFYSGGWRGVAAFAYVDAQSRGAISGAEFLVDFSDSSSDTDA